MRGIALCALGLGACSPAAWAQSAADTEAAESTMAIDMADALGGEPAQPGDGSDALQQPASGSGIAALLQPASFTLKHEIASRINRPHDTVNNRTSFRIEYEKFFLDDFYLRFDTKLTAFWGSDHRAQAEGDSVFFENSSRDAYVQYSKGDTSFKLGRQILIWGESDGGAITDVISPRNFSELFFISLEEARIGQFMATADHFSPAGNWSFFYVPDAQFNEYPEPGTAYYLDPFQGAAVVRGRDTDQGEYGLRWKRTFGRSDVSVMAAHLVDNDLSLRAAGVAADGRPLILRERQRFDMLGSTFNYASGNWLFSGELAAKSPKALGTAEFHLLDRSLIDASLRGEYALGKGGTHSVSLELTNSHVLDWTPLIAGTPRNTASLVLGWNNTFFNENLTASLLSVYSKPYTSLQHSLFLAYKWNDRVSFNLDLFYLDVDDRRSSLFGYKRDNNAVFRILYQF